MGENPQKKITPQESLVANPKLVKRFFKPSLRRTLLVWFLVISLIPMTLVVIIRGISLREYVKADAEKRLNLALRLKTLQVTLYFDHIIDTVRRYARVKISQDMVAQFQSAIAQKPKFSRSYKENSTFFDLFRRHEPNLTFLKESIGCYDILLTDTTGLILLSVSGRSEFTGNILRGMHSRTKLAAAIRRSLSTGTPVFSDYALYPVSGEEVNFGFVSAPIIDDNDHIHGIFIVQMLLSHMDDVMVSEVGTDDISDIYIVGTNLRLRSTLKEDVKRLPEALSTVLSDSFTLFSKPDLLKKSQTVTYSGVSGGNVFARYRHIKAGGVSYAVVAEFTSESSAAVEYVFTMMIGGLFLFIGLALLFFSGFLAKKWTFPINQLSRSAHAAFTGDLDQNVYISDDTEIGSLADNFNHMLANFRTLRAEDEKENWLKTGQMALHDEMRGEQELKSLGNRIIRFIARYIDLPIGIIYMASGDEKLILLGCYGHSYEENLPEVISFGDGMIGQAAIDKEMKIFTALSETGLKITSSLISVVPQTILLAPILHDDELIGVMEFGALTIIPKRHLLFLDYISENVAIALESALSRKHVSELLEKMKQQTDKLKKREEELNRSNLEFEVQTKALKVSENLLKKQQETLLDRNLVLEQQKRDIGEKNQELIRVRKLVEEKASDLERTNRYKTEFLTNMSHELRTPLNSILLLSNHLFENHGKRLSEDELTSAKTIHESGRELLEFINEILDLSKIEAGKMDHFIEPLPVSDFIKSMVARFSAHVAKQSLIMDYHISEHLPDVIHTDRQHVSQILKNFLSNALKFTEKGSITLRAYPADKYFKDRKGVTFSVKDTGVGIPEEKQSLIFEAFQQADGSINRHYGGTGLGLSISTKLAALLGGNIELTSVAGMGSTFFLHLPYEFKGDSLFQLPLKKDDSVGENDAFMDETSVDGSDRTKEVYSSDDPSFESPNDDRDSIEPGDLSILIIGCERDEIRLLKNVGKKNGWKVVVESTGDKVIELINQYRISALITDLRKSGVDGWSLLTLLKEMPEQRHMPVVMYADVEKRFEAIRSGVADFIAKPMIRADVESMFGHINHIISKKRKDLLLVEDDAIQQKLTVKVIGSSDIHITCVAKAMDAITEIESKKYDTVILDIGLPDMTGFEVLKKVRSNEYLTRLPIIVFTGRDLTREEKALIDDYAQSMVMKKADSHRKLLDDTTRFLHRRYDHLSTEQQKMLTMMHDQENIFASKRLLLVDDDMRNVFSLKQVLQNKGFEVFIGKNGLDGLAMLDTHPDIDVVLMDIAMPKMDGYTAIGKIRENDRFKDLPVIALTAKAMREDRGKCITAGASDYLAKPVHLDRLFSMLRTWLY